MAELIEISIDKIIPNSDNEKVFSMKEIEVLAKSIKEEGFYGGIEVFRIPGDDLYEISSGHRRYEAMRLLGRKTIPCIISDYPSDYKRGIKMLTSNIRARKLSPLDTARAIEYYDELLTKEGLKKDFKTQASEFFNMSPIQIYRHQCLLRIIPELQELANDPQFPYSAFREAATLSKAGQKRLYDEITYFLNLQNDNDDKECKLTRPRIEQLISNIKKDEQGNKPKRQKKDDKSKPQKNTENNLIIKPDIIPIFKKSDQTVDTSHKNVGENTRNNNQFNESPELLRVAEMITSLESEINKLSCENKSKCIRMINSLINKISNNE